MISRRDTAALLGGLGLSSLPAWASPATAQPRLTLPTQPEEQNAAKVRILGRTDDGESFWQSSGRIFAVLEDDVIPLLELRGGNRSWWRREGEHVYRRYPAALNFFVDPRTGEFIDEFVNPITGRTTPLVSAVQRRQDGKVYTPTGSYFPISKERFPDMYTEAPLSLDWRLDAGTIRLFDVENFAPVAPKPIYEVHTFFAPAEDALDPAKTRARAASSGWYTGRFSRWLDMADVEGTMIWHFEGTKVERLDDLGEDYLAHARSNTDDFDQSPEFDEGPSYIDRVPPTSDG